MDSENVVTTLNKLLETTKDGENGFRTCAGAAELEAKIRGLGKEPMRHRKRYASSRLD